MFLTRWLRLPPTKPAGPEIKALFKAIANDARFHRVAGLSDAEVQTPQNELASASFRYSNIIQAGYAGRVEGQLILGLSPLYYRLLGTLVAAHELLHLARDVRGRKRLEDEERVWREEGLVWFLTLCYAPLRGTIAVTVFLVFLAGIFCGVYWVSDVFWSWILG